jgi:hypothetical protein
MEISGLNMHASRAMYADVSLDNALKSLRELYLISLEPLSSVITQTLQRKLIRVETELFDDIWGIGRHRTFQNAFESLCLQPQGNRELWDDVWEKVEQARVTLRQALFRKQVGVQSKLPVDAVRVAGDSLTNILETEFPSICWSAIDAVCSKGTLSDTATYNYEDPDEGVDIILSSF